MLIAEDVSSYPFSLHEILPIVCLKPMKPLLHFNGERLDAAVRSLRYRCGPIVLRAWNHYYMYYYYFYTRRNGKRDHTRTPRSQEAQSARAPARCHD